MASVKICDICGAIINENRSYSIETVIKDRKRWLRMFDDLDNLSYDPGYNPVDLCKKCAREFSNLIENLRDRANTVNITISEEGDHD